MLKFKQLLLLSCIHYYDFFFYGSLKIIPVFYQTCSPVEDTQKCFVVEGVSLSVTGCFIDGYCTFAIFAYIQGSWYIIALSCCNHVYAFWKSKNTLHTQKKKEEENVWIHNFSLMQFIIFHATQIAGFTPVMKDSYFVVDNVWRLRYPSALSAFIDAWISAWCDAISVLVFFTKTMAWGLFSTVIYVDATNY